MANLEQKLNQYVADLTVMYTKLHNVHWYVEGPQFYRMHELFEDYYDQITEDMDEVAERMLQLDFKPVGSLKGVLEIAKIEERDETYEKDIELVKLVKKDFEYLLECSLDITKAAEDVEDNPTADLMIGFTAYYQKALWMLNATLK